MAGCADSDALLTEPLESSEQSPSRRLGVRSLASLAVIGLAGATAVLGRDHVKAAAKHISAACNLHELQLWYNGPVGGAWGNGWNNNWAHDGKVPCGWAVCDCGWATGDPPSSCGKRDNPRTPCWSCCCSRLYPDLYHQALSAPMFPGVGFPGAGYPGGYLGRHRNFDDGYRVGEDEWFNRDAFRDDPYFRRDDRYRRDGDRYDDDDRWGYDGDRRDGRDRYDRDDDRRDGDRWDDDDDRYDDDRRDGRDRYDRDNDRYDGRRRDRGRR